MDDVSRIAADLARQRGDLELEKRRREDRKENVGDVLAKLEELRRRIQRSRRDPDSADDELS
jgi:hypothetical protein